jgi:hypothetical protein
MENKVVVTEDKNKVEAIFTADCKLPYCKIDRNKYLTDSFKGKVNDKFLSKVLELGPINAGVSLDFIDKLAKSAIKNETTKTAGVSTVAGIPGGIAMVGTVPADLDQYYAHIFRVTQKLAYLYGYEEINLDDATENSLMLFLGVMFGVNFAVAAITKIATANAAKIGARVAAKPLTKVALYNIAKKILAFIGIKLTKDVAGKAVSKVVPIVGGLVSGGLTLATFLPMAKRLQKELSAIARMSVDELIKASEEADVIIAEAETTPIEDIIDVEIIEPEQEEITV